MKRYKLDEKTFRVELADEWQEHRTTFDFLVQLLQFLIIFDEGFDAGEPETRRCRKRAFVFDESENRRGYVKSKFSRTCNVISGIYAPQTFQRRRPHRKIITFEKLDEKMFRVKLVDEWPEIRMTSDFPVQLLQFFWYFSMRCSTLESMRRVDDENGFTCSTKVQFRKSVITGRLLSQALLSDRHPSISNSLQKRSDTFSPKRQVVAHLPVWPVSVPFFDGSTPKGAFRYILVSWLQRFADAWISSGLVSHTAATPLCCFS